MHKSLGGQSELRDVDDEEEGPAEHSMAMWSDAIKSHKVHEIWYGVITSRESFGMKKTRAPCPSSSPSLLQPFLPSLPASSPSPHNPKHPIPGIHPPPFCPHPSHRMDELARAIWPWLEELPSSRSERGNRLDTGHLRSFVRPSTRED